MKHSGPTRAARATVIGLRQAMEEAGLKPKELSDRISRDPSYLYRVLAKDGDGAKAGISVEQLDEYAKAMNLWADEILAMGRRTILREQEEELRKAQSAALASQSAQEIAEHVKSLGQETKDMLLLLLEKGERSCVR